MGMLIQFQCFHAKIVDKNNRKIILCYKIDEANKYSFNKACNKALCHLLYVKALITANFEYKTTLLKSTVIFNYF